jgi:hypothetical protein
MRVSLVRLERRLGRAPTRTDLDHPALSVRRIEESSPGERSAGLRGAPGKWSSPGHTEQGEPLLPRQVGEALVERCRPPCPPSGSAVTDSSRATGRPRTGEPLLSLSIKALRLFFAPVMLAFFIEP